MYLIYNYVDAISQHIRNSIISFSSLLYFCDVKLTSSFSDKWEGNTKGLKGALRPTTPLKSQVNEAIRKIEIQLNRLNNHIAYYVRREKELTEKIIKAYEMHDEIRAKEIAEELAELRKHKAMLVNSELSLNAALFRLRTIYEFGNFTSAICTAKEIVQNVNSKISRLMPNVGSSLSKIEDMLNGLMLEASQDVNVALSPSVESADVEKILEEASMLVKSERNGVFPYFSNEGRIEKRK